MNCFFPLLVQSYLQAQQINIKMSNYESSNNQNTIHLLEQNVDKIDWASLSINSEATRLLTQNINIDVATGNEDASHKSIIISLFATLGMWLLSRDSGDVVIVTQQLCQASV